jgi:hypothetical protein
MTEKLLNCPFCGGVASLALCGFGTARVVCMDCGSEGMYCGSRQEAIAAWNHPVGEPWASPYALIVKAISQPYTLAELRQKVDSGDYSSELLLQHAMRLLSASPPQEPREAELTDENKRLRQLLCDVLKALGNGSGASPECSMEFLSYIPEEVRLVVADLRGAQEWKAGEWLPIETAPKEQGAEVLGWFRKVKLDEDDNLTDEVVGGAIAQVSRNGDGWDEPDWLNASGAYFFDDWSFEPEPVLWHPLPAPPSTNESADSRGEKG